MAKLLAVLVLQAFAGEGRAAGSGANEEAAAAHISGRPDEIGDPLEAKHRVEDERRGMVGTPWIA